MHAERRRGFRVVSFAVSVGPAVWLGAAAMGQGPQITMIDTLPGSNSTDVFALSADGTTVVGRSGFQAIRWTAETGTVALSGMDGFSSAVARGVSADGSVICGSGAVNGLARGFRWTASGGGAALHPAQSQLNSSARGISGDGGLVVGTTELTVIGFPFHFAAGWTAGASTPNRGFGDVDPFEPNHFSEATAASADGSVVVGNSALGRSFRWSAALGGSELNPSGRGSQATGVSADGSRVVGGYEDGLGSFIWIQGVGEVELGPPSNATGLLAQAISADGMTVVGSTDVGSFLWTEALGTVDLQVYLGSLGLDLTGWWLRNASGVSADGLTIAGNGTFQGEEQAWIVTIPGPGVLGVGVAGVLVAGRRRRRGDVG